MRCAPPGAGDGGMHGASVGARVACGTRAGPTFSWAPVANATPEARQWDGRGTPTGSCTCSRPIHAAARGQPRAPPRLRLQHCSGRAQGSGGQQLKRCALRRTWLTPFTHAVPESDPVFPQPLHAVGIFSRDGRSSSQDATNYPMHPGLPAGFDRRTPADWASGTRKNMFDWARAWRNRGPPRDVTT